MWQRNLRNIELAVKVKDREQWEWLWVTVLSGAGDKWFQFVPERTEAD